MHPASVLREHKFELIGPQARTVLRDGKEAVAPYRIIRINEKLIGPKEIDGKPFIGVKLSDDDKRWLPVEQSSRVAISTAKHSADR